MARCPSCDKKIGFVKFWINTMTYTYPWTLRRYIHSMLFIPISHCPYCEAECQATVVTLSVFTVILVGGLFGTLISGLASDILDISNIHLAIIVSFIFFYILSMLWWRYFGKLKVPHKLPWERG